MLVNCIFINSSLKGMAREFPGGPVVKTQPFHCKGLGSVPGRGTNPTNCTARQPRSKKRHGQIAYNFLDCKYVYIFLNLRRKFFLTSLLEYNCFTMVCQFLLYNKVNQLYIYIYPHIPSLLRLPPTLPIPPLQVVTKH